MLIGRLLLEAWALRDTPLLKDFSLPLPFLRMFSRRLHIAWTIGWSKGAHGVATFLLLMYTVGASGFRIWVAFVPYCYAATRPMTMMRWHSR